MSVTLKVCTSIVSISRRGGEEEIIFPRREGTYLTGRCSSSNSLGDWYEQYCSPTSVGFLFLPSLLLSFGTFALLSQRKQGTPWTFKLWYPDRARPRSAQVLLVSVSEGVRRTTSPRQVSTFPPGKYNFLCKNSWKPMYSNKLLFDVISVTIRYSNDKHFIKIMSGLRMIRNSQFFSDFRNAWGDK